MEATLPGSSAPRFRPVVAIEVDGLIAVPVTLPAGHAPEDVIEMEVIIHKRAYPSSTQPEPAWGPGGTSTTRYWFSRVGLAWVDRLLTEGVEVVWASTWLEYANTYFSPTLGLPRLPIAVTEDDWIGLTIGDIKARQIARQFDGRPLLLVTDMLPQGGRRYLQALRRPADRALTELRYIPWSSSVDENDTGVMSDWLDLARSPEGHEELRRLRERELGWDRRRRDQA